MPAHAVLATDELRPGGVAHVITQLAHHLPQRGYRIDVVTLRAGEWDTRLTGRGVAVHTLPSPRAVRLLRDADIVHAHQRLPGLLAHLCGAGSRTVEHVHNEVSGQRLFSLRAPTVIAVSDPIRRHLQRVYPHLRRRDIRVVPNGARKPVGRPRAYQHRDVDLLGIGRLEPQKDPLRFLDLVDRARSGRPGLSAVWLAPGDGALRDRFLHHRSLLGLDEVVDLRVGGSHEAARELYSRAKVFALTSKWEGLPLVALEALTAGTPVATTRCGEIADIVRRGRCGAELPTAARDDAMAITAYIDDETTWRIASANAFTTADQYTEEAMVDAVEAIYRAVVDPTVPTDSDPREA